MGLEPIEIRRPKVAEYGNLGLYDAIPLGLAWVARLFKIDVKAAKKAVENDLLYKLCEDGNPLPVVVDINKLKKQ